MTVGELLEVTGGRLLCGSKNKELGAFVLSSKEVKTGDCFVAMKGESLDGNDFINEAIQNGAAAILSERHPVTYGGLYGLCENTRLGYVSFILTESVPLFLSKAATFFRERYLENVVAVTGSVGKTTVKELIYSVLKERLNVYKTEGNKNNSLGLPLSILSGKASINAVLELGISNICEMEGLSRVASPSVSVITNIGSSHMEFLGSRENIAREKLKIVTGMKDGGSLIINGDEPLLTLGLSRSDNDCISRALASKNIKIFTVSEKNTCADYCVYNVRTFADGTRFDIKKSGKVLHTDLFVPIVGRHGAFDAAFAVAVGDIFGCNGQSVRNGLMKYTPCGMRQRVEKNGEKTYIFDCYNASPTSFSAALDALKIVSESSGNADIGIVAGSMLELGAETEREHFLLGKRIAMLSPTLLITVGNEARFTADGALAGGMSAENVISFDTDVKMAKIADIINGALGKNATVLVKGSRGVDLTRLYRYLKDV